MSMPSACGFAHMGPIYLPTYYVPSPRFRRCFGVWHWWSGALVACGAAGGNATTRGAAGGGCARSAACVEYACAPKLGVCSQPRGNSGTVKGPGRGSIPPPGPRRSQPPPPPVDTAPTSVSTVRCIGLDRQAAAVRRETRAWAPQPLQKYAGPPPPAPELNVPPRLQKEAGTAFPVITTTSFVVIPIFLI